jgi:hypothetical protein
MGRTLVIIGWLASTAVSSACGSSPGDREPFAGAWSSVGEPGQRIIHLWYADGGDVPTPDVVCAGRTPPPYACAFADSRADCEAGVQVHLARWYEPFNVHFTVVAPPTDVAHDTVIITANGDWCGLVPAGLAPISCDAVDSGTAWAFACGDSAEQCAAIIAQEHAHLIGLAHTDSPRDVMFNPICTDCGGFEDRDNGVVDGRCRERQNSFALMLERLGARKP